MKKILLSIFVVLLSISQIISAKTVIKMSHPSGAIEGDPIHEAAIFLKKDIEAKSKGEIEVIIFPGGQLGSENRNAQDVQNGVIQMAMITSGNMISYCPSFGIFDFPYLFDDRTQAWNAIDAVWEKLNIQTAQECDIETIGWLEQGFRTISNSKKPIKNINDLQGLKIRVPNNRVVLATFSSFGISPIPLAWDEVFAALQQKVIDGQENPYVSLYVHKMWEIQKYVTDIHYKLWLGVFIVNAEWLDRIPAEHKAIIMESGKEATEFNRKMIVETEAKTRQMLIDKGMILTGVPEDEAEWRKRAMSIWPDYYKAIPKIELLDIIMKSTGKDRPK